MAGNSIQVQSLLGSLWQVVETSEAHGVLDLFAVDAVKQESLKLHSFPKRKVEKLKIKAVGRHFSSSEVCRHACASSQKFTPCSLQLDAPDLCSMKRSSKLLPVLHCCLCVLAQNAQCFLKKKKRSLFGQSIPF